jgi:hypothetical protein
MLVLRIKVIAPSPPSLHRFAAASRLVRLRLSVDSAETLHEHRSVITYGGARRRRGFACAAVFPASFPKFCTYWSYKV